MRASSVEVELADDSAARDQSTVDRLTQVVQAYVQRMGDAYAGDVQLLRSQGGLQTVMRCLSTSAEGLAGPADVERNRERFGANTLPKKETTPIWKLLVLASSDPMLRVLMISSVVSLVLALAFGENKRVEWIEGFAILMAVLIVIGVTACNDYLKEKQFAKLYAQEEKWSQTNRANEKQRVLIEHVVAGDVIYMEAGDEVPADALVISAHNLKVDESSLTGEPDQIRKLPFEECAAQLKGIEDAADSRKPGHHDVASPVLLSGSTIVSGSCQALIIAVGAHSQMGKLFTKLAVDSEPTPLQNKLNGMAGDVGRAGFAAATITLLVLLIEYVVDLAQAKTDRSASKIADTIVRDIVTAITIVVVAVPEGLPLAVTISLAFSVNRMLRDQNYVRRLAACETMGGASEICSDKTGTLTKNQMEVEAYWNGSTFFPVLDDLSTGTASQSGNLATPTSFWPDDPYKTILVHNIVINSSGYIATEEVPIGNNEVKLIKKQIGSPTDCALVGLVETRVFEQLQRDPKVTTQRLRNFYRGTAPPTDNLLFSLGSSTPQNHFPLYKEQKSYIVKQWPFSSEKKTMTTVVLHPSDPKKYRVFTKGAGEVVLGRCSARIDSDGVCKPLTTDKILRIEEAIIKKMAGCALRTICLAYRDITIEEFEAGMQQLREDPATMDDPRVFLSFEKNFVCLGICGIRDPLREEVFKALEDCKRAGVRVRMCTGDNIETAKQIALKAGIYHPEQGGIAMHGPEFLKLVGGVVCKKCGTERCPCESGEGDVAIAQRTIPSDTSSVELYNPKRRNACLQCICPKEEYKVVPTNATKAAREDVLGRPEEFEKIVNTLEVMARSQPTDKYALVTGLRNLGHVVAVTGDGTNDAPALKKADVGFAMGITGKETAKQASDIVLMDDNFASIVKAIKWGRNVYDNIQRFLQFQLTVNIVAVIVAFTGACILRASPLTAIQLLWINLIMDTFAALALATEMPTDKLLDRQPHSRNEYLVSRAMWRNIIAQVIYQCVVMFLVIFTGECWLPEYPFKYDTKWIDDGFTVYSKCGKRHVRSGRYYHPFTSSQDYKSAWLYGVTPSRHYTYVFNIFVFMQAFNLLNARRIQEFNIFEGLLRNPYWLMVMCVIVVGQALLVQFGGQAVSVHKNGLTWQQWLISISFGLGTWVVAALGKLIPTRVIQRLVPETHNKEINPLTQPVNLALASRGRISSGRISSRMNLKQSTEIHGNPHMQSFLQPPNTRV